MIDKKISLGNIVSWIVMIVTISVGYAVGYAKVESATAQNTRDILVATALAHELDQRQRATSDVNAIELSKLRVDVEVTKVIVSSMDKKLDQLVNRRENMAFVK